MRIRIFIEITKFCFYLTLFFIIFRLTGITDWNWWFVLMPILIYFGIFFFYVILSILMLASEDDDYYESGEVKEHD